LEADRAPRSRRAIAPLSKQEQLYNNARVSAIASGWCGDALVGLIPGIGDIVTTTLSLFIVHEAYQLGVPRHILLRMLGNVAIDGALGAVPVVGDAFDVLWRANRRNMRVLRDWLEWEEWRSEGPRNSWR